VCVELDETRFQLLFSERREARPSRSLMGLLAWIQEKLADMYGSSVGDEMVAAVEAAKRVDAKFALIDMDGQTAFKRMLREMSVRERFWFTMSVIGGIFVTKRRVEKEMKQFEASQDEYMEEIGKRFPTVKRVLMDERDAHMARQIALIQRNHPEFVNIVAVLGDAHLDGISERLECLDVEHEVLRLSDITTDGFQGSWSEEITDDEEEGTIGDSVSFSFRVGDP
jgi:pheromone shutdown protein TraB